MLTKLQLIDYNLKMLGKGAPVEIDGVGYNKIDYSRMIPLTAYSEEDIPDSAAYRISVVLHKYSNTQLTSIKHCLEETIAHYEKLMNSVKVIKATEEEILLSWSFNKVVSDFIKGSDKTKFKWKKIDGEWVLKASTEFFEELKPVLISNKFNIPEFDTVAETPKKTVVSVNRPDSSIDTLFVKHSYDKEVYSILSNFSKLNKGFWNSEEKLWEVYIEFIPELFNSLSMDSEKVELVGFEPWVSVVKSWDTSFEYAEVSSSSLPFEPWEHQLTDSKFLISKKRALNANDMGTGKTFEQVTIGESIPLKKLVIVPPSLRRNWRKEILTVNPNADVNIIYSDSEFSTSDEWNIIGYPSLTKFQKELEAEMFQCVMFDEAHAIQAVRNSGEPNSNRSKLVLRLCATSNYVYPITGTPKTNRNKNVFNILRSIRHPLTRGKWAFLNYGEEYCDGVKEKFGWNFSGNSNDEDLHRHLSKIMVRHLKRDVLPHLKKHRIGHPVEVDLREYNEQIFEYLRLRESDSAEALVRLMKARQVLAIQKVDDSIALAEGIISSGKKIVIVSCFRAVVDKIVNHFKGNCVKITGGMSDEEKELSKNSFQTGVPQVMVINIVSGGVGLTLTAAHNMIINDFDWTPGMIIQAEDRICRGGQEEEFSNIFYPYAEGADADEIIVSTLTGKFNTINNAVDGGTGDEIDFLELVENALAEC